MCVSVVQVCVQVGVIKMGMCVWCRYLCKWVWLNWVWVYDAGMCASLCGESVCMCDTGMCANLCGQIPCMCSTSMCGSECGAGMCVSRYGERVCTLVCVQLGEVKACMVMVCVEVRVVEVCVWCRCAHWYGQSSSNLQPHLDLICSHI